MAEAAFTLRDAAGDAADCDDAAVAQRTVAALVALSTAEGDVAHLLHLLTQSAHALSGVDGASIEVVDGPEIEFKTGVGLLAGSVGTRMSRTTSLSGVVVATAEVKVCADTRDDPRVDHDVCDRLGIGSMAVIPIRHSNHTVGVLTLAARRAGTITARHVELVEPLVKAGSARLIEAEAAALAETRWEMLNNIANASKEVLLAEDPGQRLVEAAARIVGAEHVMLMLPDPSGGLTVARAFGFDAPGFHVVQDETTLSGSAFVTGRTQIVADWSSHPKVPAQAIANMTEAGVLDSRAGIFVPLETPDGPAGVLAVFLPQLITAADASLLGLLQLLAAEAGVAITRAEMSTQLALQARTDPLTGAANRRVWGERFEHEAAAASRTGRPLALALLDLDFFKRYNDTHGHLAGDVLLTDAVAGWTQLLRPTDLLARLGGEEFGVLLPDTELDAAVKIMERLRAFELSDQTVSIGVTRHRVGEDPDDTTLRADGALYAAKAAGRNQVSLEP